MNPIASHGVARILIVDDHPLVCRGLTDLLAAEPDMEVCGQAADAPTALQLIGELSPDVVIVDLSLRNGSGLELLKQIRTNHPKVKPLVSSMHDESLYAERSLRAGALGYINKQEDAQQFIDAVRQVHRGGFYLSDAMTTRAVQRMAQGEEVAAAPTIQQLSDRELEVFQLIGRGQTTRQIAERLNLSIKTIETYRENIKSKLGLRNGSELTRHAVQWVIEHDA
jgi:DNA-binding NarL/FixJ family response regulator